MRWIAGLGLAAAGIFSVVAARKSSHRSRRARLGLAGFSVDPFAKTGEEGTPVYYKKPKKDEPGGCLLIGRKHENVPNSGEYRVCLTQNQEQVLLKGKKIGKKLGCGVFACAYALGRTKVVKFTHDRDDVAALLEAQGTGVVPKVYSVFKLKQPGEMTQRNPDKPWLTPSEPTVYAMTLERLKTLSVDQRKAIDEVLWNDPPCLGAGELIARICQRTLNVKRKLGEIGIDWNDVHGGNIGIDRKGDVKALDLGLTSTELKRRIDVLEGRRTPRPIKRRLRTA